MKLSLMKCLIPLIAIHLAGPFSGAEPPDRPPPFIIEDGKEGVGIVPLNPESLSITGDGVTPCRIDLLIMDKDKPLKETPRIEVDKGTILSLERMEEGVFSIIYLPPHTEAPSPSTFTFEIPTEGGVVTERGRVEILPPVKGGVRLVHSPFRVVVSKRDTFDLILEIKGRGGIQVKEPLPLTILLSEGEVAGQAWKGDGRVEVSVKLSGDRRPRYFTAIIGIPGEWEVRPCFVEVPLFGIPDLKINSEPGTRLEIEAEGRKYGPYEVPDGGEIRPGILTSPGTGEVHVRARDRAGNISKTVIDLSHSIPFNPLLYAPALDIFPAIDSQVPIYIFIPPRLESALSDMKLISEHGTTGGLVREGKGVFRAVFKPPERGFTSDFVSFNALFKGGGEVRKGITFRLRSGPPSLVKIDAIPGELTPESRRANLDILVLDALGEGVSGQNIHIEVEGAVLSPVSEIGRGLYRAELTGSFKSIPDGLLKRGGVKGKVRVELSRSVAPFPHRIHLFPEGGGTVGERKGVCTALVVDRAGYPVPDQKVRVATRYGPVSADPFCETDHNGECRVEYGVEGGVNGLRFSIINAWVENFSNVSTDLPLPNFPEGMKGKVSLIPRQRRSKGTPSVEGEFLVETLPGRVKDVVVHVDPPLIEGVEGGGARIFIRLKDSLDNYVSGRNLLIRASRGRVERVMEREPGRYSAIYRPEPGFSGNAMVTITTPEGDFATSTRISILRRERRVTASFTGGYITNFSAFHAPILDLDLSYKLKKGTESLSLTGGAGYIYYRGSASFEEGESPGFGLDFNLLPIHGGLNYLFSYRGLNPFLGTSIALFALYEKVRGKRLEDVEYYEVVPGYSIYGGISWPLGPGNLLFETGLLSDISVGEWFEGFGILGMTGGIYFSTGYRIGVW